VTFPPRIHRHPLSTPFPYTTLFRSQLSADPIADGDSYAIVEFHSDVDMSEARALTLERNIRVVERASLLPYQLLVAGPLDQVERSEEHTSELQSRGHLVCRLLLEKK